MARFTSRRLHRARSAPAPALAIAATTARFAASRQSARPKTAAERHLKEQLGKRASRTSYDEITPDSSFGQLIDLWLADLDLENKVAERTRALYERNTRQLVMPACEHFTLRGTSVRKVARFLKTLGATKNYSTECRW